MRKSDNESTLILPIKKKWYDMISSGEKEEEYREIKPYWTSRFMKKLGLSKSETEWFHKLLAREEKQRILKCFFAMGIQRRILNFSQR